MSARLPEIENWPVEVGVDIVNDPVMGTMPASPILPPKIWQGSGVVHGAVLIATFGVAHALALWIAGANSKPVSYIFMNAAPLIAAAACMWRIVRNRSAQGWGELTLALLLWAAGMAAGTVFDLIWAGAEGLPGLSMFFYVLYGAPLIFAAASPAQEQWHIRAVDAFMALLLGGLFWVHSFSFAGADHPDDAGFLAIRWLFDIENSFIALFALVRWQAAMNAQERGFFATFSAFACIYGVVAAIINHAASDIDFGTLVDVVIPLPFLWLANAVVNERFGQSMTTAPSPHFSLAVRAGSPLMLPATLLIVSCALLFKTTELAAAGLVLAMLGYGLRNILTQMRGIAEQDRLERLSHQDALTGLPNRRQFDERLQREWTRASASGGQVAVLLIDIDHFKLLNDGLGHLVGDQRLREVGQVLAASLTRSSDLVGRYGGEEFVAILPDVTASWAADQAEQMRRAVAARALSTTAPRGIVTVSIGVGWTCDTRADPPERIIAMADAALYRAKEKGRDQVEWARDGAQEGQAKISESQPT